MPVPAPPHPPCPLVPSLGWQTVYLFDVRMGTVLHKLREGIHDVVGDVCFHPMHPQLAAATYDGKLRFFSS